jgi:hypothetical protein
LLAASNDDDVNVGNIPHELSQLSSLQWLYLSDNNLSGESYDAISVADAGDDDVKRMQGIFRCN